MKFSSIWLAFSINFFAMFLALELLPSVVFFAVPLRWTIDRFSGQFVYRATYRFSEADLAVLQAVTLVGVTFINLGDELRGGKRKSK